MAGTADCIRRLTEAAGRALTEDEVRALFERIHKAALDIKAGRVEGGQKLGGKIGKALGGDAEDLITAAAREAAATMEQEAARTERQAELQLVRLGARMGNLDTLRGAGLGGLDAIEKMIARDYTGAIPIESLEQRAEGYRAYYKRKLMDTWEALGSDYLGFFQDRGKLLDLVKELRGEDSGNPLAKRGAEAFHQVAEEARTVFNQNGGDVGKLDDWGMPQHHSQEKVAAAGRDAWVDAVLPLLDQPRYVDSLGQPRSEAELREFLGHAWDTIATDGIANLVPGESQGFGKRANRHAEARQIHFRDAESYIDYWNQFGNRTALEILMGHVDTMARDTAFIEYMGPDPNMTFQTLKDTALRDAVMADPTKTPELQGRAVKLEQLYDYAAGRAIPTYNRTLKAVADGIAHLNTAGKLGGAMIASLFGDKPMLEAVSHMNDLPMIDRWRNELVLLSPTKGADRALLQRQGLMLDSVRSGLTRFYEGLGESSRTGKIANAVMRITGMQAINDIRKGSFGLTLMSAIGAEVQGGRDWANLARSDVRTLRQYGITKADWETWQVAGGNLDTIAGVEHVLTPEAIARVTDDQLRAAGVIDQAAGPEAGAEARRQAIVKLMGAVNTESEFAIVTPGWRERAQFYGDLQRGTVKGEIARSVLQFKAFPWAFLQRGMDAVANMDGPTSKAIMGSWLIGSTTLAGAMIMQTREMLAGKDPRAMMDKNWYKFWAAAFLQGGALGIYGDFLYGVNETRYGSGPLEALAGPTMGPLLELGVVQPLTALKKATEGKDTHLAAQTIKDLKGFIPGNNIWYLKAATEHLVWQRVMEALSPGYLNTIRSKTAKEYGQDWWWRPGEPAPERAPNLERMTATR